MSTRIIINGQEYSGVGAMPENVRTACQAALAMLRVQQSSITLNGQRLGGVGRAAAAMLPLATILLFGLAWDLP